LKVYQDEELSGMRLLLEVASSILAVDSSVGYVVVELKVSRGHDESSVNTSLHGVGKKVALGRDVRGIIVFEKLQLAALVVAGLGVV
jgi:hypothetical protein